MLCIRSRRSWPGRQTHRRSSVSMPVMDTDSGSDESAFSTLQHMSRLSMPSSVSGSPQGLAWFCSLRGVQTCVICSVSVGTAAWSATLGISPGTLGSDNMPDLLCVLPYRLPACSSTRALASSDSTSACSACSTHVTCLGQCCSVCLGEIDISQSQPVLLRPPRWHACRPQPQLTRTFRTSDSTMVRRSERQVSAMTAFSSSCKGQGARCQMLRPGAWPRSQRQSGHSQQQTSCLFWLDKWQPCCSCCHSTSC